MNKIILGSVISAFSFGTVIITGYFVVNKCRPSSSLNGERQPAIASSSPLRASTQVYLDASTEDVFDYLSNSSSLPQWMPGLDSVTYDHSDSVSPGNLDKGSRRTLMFGDQEETEIIVQYDYPKAIAYQITAGVPVNNHLAVMTVEPNSNEGTILTWDQYFDLETSSLYGWGMPFLVRRFVNEGQANLIEEFDGEAIHRCQYGPL